MLISPINPRVNFIRANNKPAKPISFTAKSDRCELCGNVAYEKEPLEALIKNLLEGSDDKMAQALERLRPDLPSPEKHAIKLIFAIHKQNQQQQIADFKNVQICLLNEYLTNLEELKTLAKEDEKKSIEVILKSVEEINTTLQEIVRINNEISVKEALRQDRKRELLLANPPANKIKHTEEELNALQSRVDSDPELRAAKNTRMALIKKRENLSEQSKELISTLFVKHCENIQALQVKVQKQQKYIDDLNTLKDNLDVYKAHLKRMEVVELIHRKILQHGADFDLRMARLQAKINENDQKLQAKNAPVGKESKRMSGENNRLKAEIEMLQGLKESKLGIYNDYKAENSFVDWYNNLLQQYGVKADESGIDNSIAEVKRLEIDETKKKKALESLGKLKDQLPRYAQLQKQRNAIKLFEDPMKKSKILSKEALSSQIVTAQSKLEEIKGALAFYNRIQPPQGLIDVSENGSKGIDVIKQVIEDVHKTLDDKEGLLPQEKFVLKNCQSATNLLRATLAPLLLDNSQAVLKVLKGEQIKLEDEKTCRNCNAREPFSVREFIEQTPDAIKNFEAFLRDFQGKIHKKLKIYQTKGGGQCQ